MKWKLWQVFNRCLKVNKMLKGVEVSVKWKHWAEVEFKGIGDILELKYWKEWKFENIKKQNRSVKVRRKEVISFKGTEEPFDVLSLKFV